MRDAIPDRERWLALGVLAALLVLAYLVLLHPWWTVPDRRSQRPDRKPAAARPARAHGTQAGAGRAQAARGGAGAGRAHSRLHARAHARTGDLGARAAPGNRRRRSQSRQPQLRDHQPLAVDRAAPAALPARGRAGAPALRQSGTRRGAAFARERRAAPVRRQPQRARAALFLRRRPGRRRTADSTSASTSTATFNLCLANRCPERPRMRVDGTADAGGSKAWAGPRTWLLAAVAGWALTIWALGLFGLGGRIEVLPDDPSLLQRLPQAAQARRGAPGTAGPVFGDRRATAVQRRSPAAAVLHQPGRRGRGAEHLRLRPHQRAADAAPDDGDRAADRAAAIRSASRSAKHPRPRRPGRWPASSRAAWSSTGPRANARSSCACSTVSVASRRRRSPRRRSRDNRHDRSHSRVRARAARSFRCPYRRRRIDRPRKHRTPRLSTAARNLRPRPRPRRSGSASRPAARNCWSSRNSQHRLRPRRVTE